MAAASGTGMADDGLSSATILSDLSANIFAALLIILILLLQLKVAADGQPFPKIDAGLSLPIRRHAALGAGDMIALLRARGPASAGAAFDLVDTGIRPTVESEPVAGSAIADVVAATAGNDVVRLYVFSNRWFAATTKALTEKGRAWTDLSVPRALRNPDNPQAWSRGFLRLAAARGDLGTFRDGLARLLAASTAPLVPGGRVAAGGAGDAHASATAYDTSPLLQLSALRHLLALTVAGLALTVAIAFVVVLEFALDDRVPDFDLPSWRWP